jgi:hypothetical protein
MSEISREALNNQVKFEVFETLCGAEFDPAGDIRHAFLVVDEMQRYVSNFNLHRANGFGAEFFNVDSNGNEARFGIVNSHTAARAICLAAVDTVRAIKGKQAKIAQQAQHQAQEEAQDKGTPLTESLTGYIVAYDTIDGPRNLLVCLHNGRLRIFRDAIEKGPECSQ